MSNLEEERKQETYRTYLHFSLYFVFVLFALTFVIRIPRPYSNDDVSIANFLSGTLGAEYATPYVSFINILLGWMMVFLYKIFPDPNWFIVLQVVIEYVSLCFFQTILIDCFCENFRKHWAYILSSGLLLMFAPSVICKMEFTQTAAIGAMTGVLWILYSWKNESKIGVLFGIVHAVVSFWFRKKGFLICFPFIFLIVIRLCWQHRKEIADYLPKLRKLGLYMGVFIAILLVCSGINRIAWNTGEQKAYKSFNSARARFKDYPVAPYGEVAEELKTLGISQNDYEIMDSWQFADPEFITTELLIGMTAIEKKATGITDYREEIREYFDNFISDPFSGFNNLLSLSVVLCILVVGLNFKRNGSWAILTLLCVFLLEIYFKVYVRRYPSWVHTSVLFCGIVSFLLMLGSQPILRKNHFFTGMVIMIFAIGAAFLGDAAYVDGIGSFSYDQSSIELYKWMHSQEGKIFFCPTSSSGMPALSDAYSVFKATEPGFTKGTVSLGGWGTNNPARKRAYADEGITNPLQQTADHNVFIVTNYWMATKLRQYLFEHTGKEASLSLVDDKNGVLIWKAIDRNDYDFPMETGVEANKIDDLLCEYDQEQDLWNLTVQFTSDGGNSAGNREIFLRVFYSGNEERVYMAFSSEEKKEPKGAVIFRIPRKELEAGEYSAVLYTISDNQEVLYGQDISLKINEPTKDGET